MSHWSWALLAYMSTVGALAQSIRSITQEDIDSILSLHNKLRSAISPLATDMYRVTWDTTLAGSAQKYADTCPTAHSGWPNLGENMSWGWPTMTASDAVQEWIKEAPNYAYTSNTCASGKVCAHYTQMIWNNSSKIGCGVKSCAGLLGQAVTDAWVCHYTIPGNVIGSKPYTTGATACSACPQTTVCSENLCTISGTSTSSASTSAASTSETSPTTTTPSTAASTPAASTPATAPTSIAAASTPAISTPTTSPTSTTPSTSTASTTLSVSTSTSATQSTSPSGSSAGATPSASTGVTATGPAAATGAATPSTSAGSAATGAGADVGTLAVALRLEASSQAATPESTASQLSPVMGAGGDLGLAGDNSSLMETPVFVVPAKNKTSITITDNGSNITAGNKTAFNNGTTTILGFPYRTFFG